MTKIVTPNRPSCQNPPHALAASDCAIRKARLDIKTLAEAVMAAVRAPLKEYSPAFVEAQCDYAVHQLNLELISFGRTITARAADLDRKLQLKRGNGCPKHKELLVLRSRVHRKPK